MKYLCLIYPEDAAIDSLSERDYAAIIEEVLAFRDPKEAGLPVPTINSSFIFARGDGFLCYPNNYNYFANYYRNSFQHGGVSMEEMIIPVIRMVGKPS